MPKTCCIINSSFGFDRHNDNCRWAPKSLSYNEGVADIAFHRTDDTSFVLKGVLFDSLSNVAANPGVISGEFENGNPFHVPFVQWWEVLIG